MAVTTYICLSHGVRCAVDTEHRTAAIQTRPLSTRAPASGSCVLGREWHKALKDPRSLLGPHGAWHPRRSGSSCDVIEEA